jgi:hypothetical protein
MQFLVFVFFIQTGPSGRRPGRAAQSDLVDNYLNLQINAFNIFDRQAMPGAQKRSS